MRSNQKLRKLYLFALICYLIGLCLLVIALLDSHLRFLYILCAIAEILGAYFNLQALAQ